MIAVLSNKSINISQSYDLKTLQTLNKSVHTFCLNNAVYKSNTLSASAATSDQICIATTDKQLFFYDFVNSYG